MRIRVEAPAGMSSFAVAQAIVGDTLLLKAEPVASARPFELWPTLDHVYAEASKLYDAQMKRMLARIIRVLEGEDLEKAKKRHTQAPLLTVEQMNRIARLIRDYHTAITIRIGAGDAIDPKEVARLIKLKILPPETMDVIKDAYLYGQLLATVRSIAEREDITKLTYPEFKQRVKERPMPLTEAEQRSLQWARTSAALHIRSLGNRISDDTSKRIIRHDGALHRELQRVVRTELEANIERRQTVRKLASELGNATQDWNRDWGRVAATEKHQAFQEGYAQSLMKNVGPPEKTFVAKLPKPTACPSCVELHLTAGQGSRPRVFALSELMQHGTNVGKKQAQWQAVVGTVHPWCQCQLIHVPAGFAFEKRPKEKGYREVEKGRWEKDGKPWSPRLMPEVMERSVDPDLLKASWITYPNVPEEGVAIRVSDPASRIEVEKVVAQTPKELFHRHVGITLITTDTSRPGTALDEHDLAYWTANEIRLSQTLPAEKVGRVLRHEMGHALNVYLMNVLGTEEAVKKWHRGLYAISKEEGFVSPYARTSPIEDAAEVTRWYLYRRAKLMLEYPRQFAYAHRYYRAALKPREPKS